MSSEIEGLVRTCAGTGTNLRSDPRNKQKSNSLKNVEDEVKHDTGEVYKELEACSKRKTQARKQKEYVVNAIQICAVIMYPRTTISVVQLPNDEMIRCIIGREGRNNPLPLRP